jgi:hypothetical protein
MKNEKNKYLLGAIFFIERKRNDDKHFWSKKQKEHRTEK